VERLIVGSETDYLDPNVLTSLSLFVRLQCTHPGQLEKCPLNLKSGESALEMLEVRGESSIENLEGG